MTSKADYLKKYLSGAGGGGGGGGGDTTKDEKKKKPKKVKVKKEVGKGKPSFHLRSMGRLRPAVLMLSLVC
jgi:hypothetical protein